MTQRNGEAIMQLTRHETERLGDLLAERIWIEGNMEDLAARMSEGAPDDFPCVAVGRQLLADHDAVTAKIRCLEGTHSELVAWPTSRSA